VQCVKEGYFQREIQRSAYQWQREVESGARQVVGVNAYRQEAVEGASTDTSRLLKVNPKLEQSQVTRLQALRASRDAAAAQSALDRIRDTARARGPMVETFIDAVKAMCTVGEICDVLREEFGEHRESVML